MSKKMAGRLVRGVAPGVWLLVGRLNGKPVRWYFGNRREAVNAALRCMVRP